MLGSDKTNFNKYISVVQHVLLVARHMMLVAQHLLTFVSLRCLSKLCNAFHEGLGYNNWKQLELLSTVVASENCETKTNLVQAEAKEN